MNARVEYWAYRCGGWISRTLPREQAYWIGLRLSDWYYASHRKDREAVKSNLERVFKGRGIQPSSGALELGARRVFHFFGKYLVDFFRYAHLTKEEVRRLVSIEHLQRLENERKRGAGVLLITAHLGNWELGGAVLAALGYSVHAVYHPHRLRKINRLFHDQRERRGIHPLPLGRAASGILRALQRGEIVALLADRDFTANSEHTPFFGRPARLPVGPARLAAHTGAPIVPAFLLREVDDTYVLRVHEPIRPEAFGRDARKIHTMLASVLEEAIGRHPHQWFLFEKFWP